MIAAGYLLNFLKGFVPCLINAYRTMSLAYMCEGFAELMYVDILHFSGLAMMMFGLFRLLKASHVTAGLFGLGFAGLNLLLLPIKVENFWLSSLTGLF